MEIEQELHDKTRQIESSFRGKKPGDVNAVGHTEAGELRTTEEDAARKILRTTSKTPKCRREAGPTAGTRPAAGRHRETAAGA